MNGANRRRAINSELCICESTFWMRALLINAMYDQRLGKIYLKHKIHRKLRTQKGMCIWYLPFIR